MVRCCLNCNWFFPNSGRWDVRAGALLRSAGWLPPNCLCAQFISADSADAKNRPTSPFMSCYSQKFHSSFLLSKKKSNPVSQNWRLSEKNLGARTNMSNCLSFISIQQINTSKTKACTHIHTAILNGSQGRLTSKTSLITSQTSDGLHDQPTTTFCPPRPQPWCVTIGS